MTKMTCLAVASLAVLLTALLSSCGYNESIDNGPSGTVTGTSDASLDGTGGQSDGTGVVDTGHTDVSQADAGRAPDVAPSIDAPAPVDSGPNGCSADQCTIAGACHDNGAVDPANPCNACLVLTNASAWTANDAAKCDDGEGCTDDDHCNAGKCVGADVVCEDGNSCTDDQCDDASGDCVFAANSVTCTLADLCSQNDTCVQGQCEAGDVVVCNDANPCTDDSCASAKGCVHAPNSANCDDSDKCTEGDTCAAGLCAQATAVNCDDSSVCTIDYCKPESGCAHDSIADLCPDENLCTDDSCDPVKGCVYDFNNKPCDDTNKCTAADTCSQGACLGNAVSVDDKNPCTDDACVPATGISHVANKLPCEDGNKCTLGDKCAAKACEPGADKPDCNDDNPCTDDACQAASGCTNTNNTDPCDDESKCTDKDVCGKGKCAGAAISCDDGNPCTTDACTPAKGCSNTLIISNACRPQIVITYPPRGATIKQPGPKITVKGKVSSGAGPITSFTLNGAKVALAKDGSFAVARISKVGGNELLFKAQDSMGSKRKRVQAYLWSTKYFKPQLAKPKSGMVDPGLGYFLAKQVIDDGDHSLPPNDLATIFELYMQNLKVEEMLPDPAYKASNAEVKISNLKYDKATVTLEPVDGGLYMKASIPKLKGDVVAKVKLLFWWTTSKGTLTIDSIDITATVAPKVVNNALVVDLKSVTVKINGLKMQVSGLLNSVINSVLESNKKELETQLQKSIASEFGPALQSALSALAVSVSMNVDKLDDSGDQINAKLVTDFSEVIFKPDGGVFNLRAGVYAKKNNSIDNHGVPGRIGCGKSPQKLAVLKQFPLELSLADDALNELLYAMWLGGLLEFPVPKSMLGDVDLSALGAKNLKLKATALLAPTVDDCNPKGVLEAFIGDLRVDASLEVLGAPMNVVLWVTMVADTELKAEKGQVSIALTNVKSVQTEVIVKQDQLVASEAAIEKLIAGSLVDGLMSAIGGKALGAFPLPVVDLSASMPGLPPGTGIAIDPKKVTRKDGNSIIGGTLK